jgi:hypothetical protein
MDWRLFFGALPKMVIREVEMLRRFSLFHRGLSRGTLPKTVINGKAATTIGGQTTSRTRSCSGVGDDVAPFAKRLGLFRLSTKEDILSRVHLHWASEPMRLVDVSER